MSDQPFVHHPNWAQTIKGTPIALFHCREILSLHEPQGPVLMIGGVHGDEPEGVALAQGLLDWLKNKGRGVPRPSLEPWIMIPCLNPDGYQSGQRVNANGVDLNRNYPSKSWSAEAKAPRYFPGTRPASELEIQAVVRLIEAVRPCLIIHFHSWNPCVVLTGEPGREAAQKLAQASGYNLVESIGYETPGSLSEFGWGECRIPVICIEEQEGAPLSSVWPRFAPGLIQILTRGEQRS